MGMPMLAEMGGVTIAILVFLGIIVLGFFLIILRFVNIWVQALSSGAKVSFFELIGMWLRKVPSTLIVRARISAIKAGLEEMETSDLESVFLVRKDASDVMTCVNSLIIAHKANLQLDFDELQAHHFAGGHVIELVQAMIAAHRAKIDISLDVARAIDLAGSVILDAVQTPV